MPDRLVTAAGVVCLLLLTLFVAAFFWYPQGFL